MSGPSIRDQWNNWSASRSNNSDHASSTMFSSWKDSLSESANQLYTRLPIYEREESTPEPSWFNLSRLERLVAFGSCILAGAFFFGTSFVLFPVLAIQPRKFALLWTLGSICFVAAFAVLNGPIAYFRHMVSKERVAFSGFFLVTVLSTLYFAVIVKSTILTVISGVAEMVAVVYYTISYFPFGAQTLGMLTSAGGRQAISMIGF
ncbi:Sft2 protein [Saccharomycopsis crataegensis]|uniref:Protein transport protein SFT2 n=1 Tax=Saccharomycopsis crataegensis TaxID=43959 RepID=A0AAV5QT90_9ASCO|nr:Sft2 protein [Saccharomycopsis crataegensis]